MILLRHCQSEFNLHFTRTRRDPGIVDPALTPEGLEQAERAADAIGLDAAAGRRISRIIVSPYRRALQTAAPIAARLGLTPLVSSLIRERYAFVCDVGSPRSTLQRDWPGIDFSGLDETWWQAGLPVGADAPDIVPAGPEVVPVRESEESVIGRAAAFRAQMTADPDWRSALVVSHWGFLLALSGHSIENGQWLRVDPTVALLEPVVWQHPHRPSGPGDIPA